jgi:Type VI secretion system/phage-baseplate injector OB domain
LTTTDDAIIELTRMVTGRFFGKFRATVKEIGEGDRLGYIRAIVPDIYGTSVPSPWAAPCVPAAGPGSGFFVMPRENDLVWIEFEGGAPSSPLWTGFCWASGEAPEGAAPRTHVFASPDGHRFVLDDESNTVTLAHADGPSIELKGSSITLTVGSKSIEIGSSSVKINGVSLEVT